MNAIMALTKKLNKGKGIDGPGAQLVIGIILIVTIIVVLLPILITVLLSLKSNYEISMGIWKLPEQFKWGNWSIGFNQLLPNMLNSIAICLLSTAGIVFFSSISAYVFTRHSFPGKEALFYAIIALMIVPAVLTLTPSYVLMIDLGIKNTWWALLFHYIAGGQIGAIFLLRTFMSQQPGELFEAAKMDGAGEWVMYAKIAVPLAIPILSVQAVTSFSSIYNDFLWPILVIDEQRKQMLMPVLRALTNQTQGEYREQGISYAMFLLSGLPLVFTTLFGLRYFINGDFASGMKL